MKSPSRLLLPAAIACISLGAGGCSLFHHKKKEVPWHPKPLGPGGPMQGDPQEMIFSPVEPNPRPISPETMQEQPQ